MIRKRFFLIFLSIDHQPMQNLVPDHQTNHIVSNTPSVHEEKRDNIMLSKNELNDMLQSSVEQGANKIIEQQNKELIEWIEQKEKELQEREQALKDREEKLLQIESEQQPKKWWEFWK